MSLKLKEFYSMDWQYLKDKVYFSDGSLRDIYVLDTLRSDWQKWIDFVNENYKIKFEYCDYDGNLKFDDKIISKPVFDFWDKKNDFTVNATINVGNIIVKCYFFTEEELENDIEPLEVKNIDYHDQIIEYLKSVSKILNKEVILTTESYSANYDVLVTVNNNHVLIK
ncbi:hypothetical protein MUU74_10370 [Chryseobacterium daecheongense]|uniref:hypothetical protein n=1 Tax=Chryseobacterium daecheongense TaxID=192389 RepID=UPI001FD676BC|nr:hypothetical protein [Chryseobacterium daecheongense]UOU96897.1 hypothetical protein MUU74_10370 [Chryseobacterium daecheongense]